MADGKHVAFTVESQADLARLAQRCETLSATAVTIERGGGFYKAAVVRSFTADPETLRLSVVFDGALWGLCMNLEEFVAASLRGAGTAPRVAEE